MNNEVLLLSEDRVERQWARLLGNNNLVIITEKWNIYTDDWEHLSSAYFKVESIQKLAKWLNKKQDERQIEIEREKEKRKNIVAKDGYDKRFLARAYSIVEYQNKLYIILWFDHKRKVVGMARWLSEIEPNRIRKLAPKFEAELLLPFEEYEKCKLIFRW